MTEFNESMRNPNSQPGCTANGAPGTESTPGLLTTAEVAKMLSLGERTVWRWSRSGVMPSPVKLGAGRRPSVRYRRSEIVEWMEAGCPKQGKLAN